MQIVNDEEQEDAKMLQKDESKIQNEDGARRTPVKLRGRGGFGHFRGGRGQRSTANSAAEPVSAASTSDIPPSKSTSESVDPVDGLASRMSALQFVPRSIYSRGKG